MLKKSMKKVLSFALVLFMVIGLINPAQGTKAAEDSLLWEAVDEEIDLNLAEATEKAEQKIPAYADGEIVRVIIEFEDDAVIDAGFDVSGFAKDKAAIKYSANLEKKQNSVISKIEKKVFNGEELDVNYNFTLLTNAASTDVEYGKIDEIEAVAGVKAVHIAPVYEVQGYAVDEPQMASAGEMVGTYWGEYLGYTGAGMRIAIIDTGINYDHPQFDPDAFMYALEQQAERAGRTVESYDLLDAEEITSVAAQLNASSRIDSGVDYSEFYGNAKIPFAFNYVDRDFDITHDIDEQGPHGSHVSGIAAANRYVPTEDGYDYQERGVKGIAPEAQILTMKVFGKGGGAYSDDYMAAIEDALVLGADVINLSLGSSAAGETSEGEAYVDGIFDKLSATDTIVSISAGNNGAFADNSVFGYNRTDDVNVATGGSPGSYTNAFTVASCINTAAYGFGFNVAGTDYGYIDTTGDYTNEPFTGLAGNGQATEYEYVFTESFGKDGDFAGLDLTGKIVFCSRGENSFYEKHMNAEAAGAVAAVVYNNTDGAIRMNLTGSTAVIPCVSIYQSDAEAIKAASEYDEATGTYTGKLVVNAEETLIEAPDAYYMSDFSSWGVPGDLTLKPEITAPGENILSTVDESESDDLYAYYSGTSMAAPCIAGISALVLQYIKENDIHVEGLTDRALAQSLIMSTAQPLVDNRGEGYYRLYSPRKQGAGLADVRNAIAASSYILIGDAEGNDGKVKVELGDDPERTGRYEFDFTVYNINPDAVVYYQLGSTFQTETPFDGLTMNRSDATYRCDEFEGEDIGYIFDCNMDGIVDEADAQYLLAYVNGSVPSTEPIDAFNSNFDFNYNGVVDTDDVRTFYRSIIGEDFWATDTQYVKVSGQTTIHASVTLQDYNREELDYYFENGSFVEGFVTLYGGASDLSFPFLAFYGNWSDSSMYEPFDFMEYWTDPENGNYGATYTGLQQTNFLTYTPAGDSDLYYYVPNNYEDDDEYIADRNAFSSTSGDCIPSVYYSLIRNAYDVQTIICNAETGEVYQQKDEGMQYAEFWYAAAQSWQNYYMNADLDWMGTDASGAPLADGTKVEIKVKALPAYYMDDTKVIGKGTELVFPMTIDNTAPAAQIVSNSVTEAEDGSKTAVISVSDNRYVAAVKVLNSEKSEILASYAVNQTEEAATTELEIVWPDELFYVVIIDYAGNMTTFRVNNTDTPDTTIASAISISEETATITKGGSIALSAIVSPWNLGDHSVIWSSSDASVADVNANGVVTGVDEGFATITATTVALGEDGEPLSAECLVEVITLSRILKATLWDEDGNCYFVSFDTSTIPEYETITPELDVAFWAACDSYRKDGLVYATEDNDLGEYQIYAVDLSGDEIAYELVQLDDYTCGGTDLANGLAHSTIYTPFYGEIHCNLVDEDGYVTYDGYWDLSEIVGSDDLMGIAYAGWQYNSYYEDYVDFFYLVNTSGEVFIWNVIGDQGYYCEKIGDLGITTDYYYPSSLYYCFEDDALYFSSFDGFDTVNMYMFRTDFSEETETEYISEFYQLGSFDTDVYPVSGLFEYDLDADDVEAAPAKQIAYINMPLTQTAEAAYVSAPARAVK